MLNFCQLYPIAPNLNLIIIPSNVFQITILLPSHQIAGLIQSTVTLLPLIIHLKGIRNKKLLCQHIIV